MIPKIKESPYKLLKNHEIREIKRWYLKHPEYTAKDMANALGIGIKPKINGHIKFEHDLDPKIVKEIDKLLKDLKKNNYHKLTPKELRKITEQYENSRKQNAHKHK